MPQLSCKNLTLGYENRIILENINFEVNKGDYLCIIGANGTGKTTLMKAILGLKKPISGEIIWGEGLHHNHIGYLNQQSEIQREFPASVYEVVISGFQKQMGLKPFYSKTQKVKARQLMQKMGIENLAKKCYRELSGGQQQRVLLARALCATGEILFLDEPIAGLDPEVSAGMYEVMENLNIDDNITIMMISHDVETAIEYATHILRIGNVPFFGTKAEYLEEIKCHCQEVEGV